MKNDTINLVLSIDVYFSDNSSSFLQKNITILKDISKIISKILESYTKPKTVWLISDDNSTLKEFNKIKSEIVLKNDEVGLHCLVPKFLDIKNTQSSDLDNYVKNAITKLNEYEITPNSNRIMGCTASNDLMNVLSKNGIKVDSSAIPGRKRDIDISFDWSTTPSNPYFPSTEDYRISSKNNLNILEVPLCVIQTKSLYDKNPILRYFDLSFKNNIIEPSLEQLIKKNSHVVSIIHPEGLIKSDKSNELLSHNIKEFEKNIAKFCDIADNLEKKVNCITFEDITHLENFKECDQ